MTSSSAPFLHRRQAARPCGHVRCPYPLPVHAASNKKDPQDKRNRAIRPYEASAATDSHTAMLTTNSEPSLQRMSRHDTTRRTRGPAECAPATLNPCTAPPQPSALLSASLLAHPYRTPQRQRQGRAHSLAHSCSAGILKPCHGRHDDVRRAAPATWWCDCCRRQGWPTPAIGCRPTPAASSGCPGRTGTVGAATSPLERCKPSPALCCQATHARAAASSTPRVRPPRRGRPGGTGAGQRCRPHPLGAPLPWPATPLLLPPGRGLGSSSSSSVNAPAPGTTREGRGVRVGGWGWGPRSRAEGLGRGGEHVVLSRVVGQAAASAGLCCVLCVVCACPALPAGLGPAPAQGPGLGSSAQAHLAQTAPARTWAWPAGRRRRRQRTMAPRAKQHRTAAAAGCLPRYSQGGRPPRPRPHRHRLPAAAARSSPARPPTSWPRTAASGTAPRLPPLRRGRPRQPGRPHATRLPPPPPRQRQAGLTLRCRWPAAPRPSPLRPPR